MQGVLGGTVSGLNMQEFDEEINGVNLGKLFSIYGPNSVENKKRRANTMGRSGGHTTAMNRT